MPASGNTKLQLGNVFLPYTRFSWPKYRGVIARPIEIDCPAEFYGPLVALAKGLQGGTTELTVTAPANAGAHNTPETITIRGIYIDRVIKQSEALCRVVLYDRRFILSRYIFPRDFNIRFGDKDSQGRIKYLNGTEFATFANAVIEAFDSKSQADNAFREIVNPESFTAPDGLHLSGLTYAQGLGDLLDRYSMSLTVWNDGRLRVVDMSDGNLPKKGSYSWEIEPGWSSEATYICGRPANIYVYYLERHCLKMEGGSTTVAHRGPQELRVELEQVYKYEDDTGQPLYGTLAELLESQGFSSSAIDDADIAKRYMSETFQGTALYTEYETEAARLVIRSIKECWRRLWRVKFVGAGGAIGGWTNWAFGKMNADGSVLPVTVECPWVEFLNEPAPVEGGGGQLTFIGAAVTENHASPAPFSADWEGGDPSLGIIRLTQNAIRDHNFAVPGALSTPLTVEQVAQVRDGDDNPKTVQDGDFDYVEAENYDKAEFSESFSIAIYACATRRMPNNESRWHLEVADGFDDADIGYVELPVGSELLCYRDYVSSESGHAAQADGLGPILNATQLEQDAAARASVWKATHASGIDGFGVAQSLKAFREVEVRGAVAEVVLEIDGEQVQTRIVAGNLADTEARVRRAAKRLADRSFTTAGAR